MDSKVIPLTPQPGQQRVKHDKTSTSTSGASNQSNQTEAAGSGPKLASIDVSSLSSGKGGGALRSIDQKFEVNPCNGTLSLSLPLKVTEARNQLHPSLALSYNSGSGNGPFGMGWNIALENVTRKTSKNIPQYDSTDVFLLSKFDDLVPVKEPNRDSDGYEIQRFSPRVEQGGGSAKIELWTNRKDRNDSYWRTISDTNVVKIYGRTDESRIFETTLSGTKRIFSWLICETYDASGNAMVFSYKLEDGVGVLSGTSDLSSCEMQRPKSARTRARYIKSILYGNRKPSRDLETWAIVPATRDNSEWLFEVVFDYGEHDIEVPTTSEANPWAVRKDAFSSYSSGFEIRTYRLCKRVLMFHHIKEKLHLEDYLVSTYHLQYDHLRTGSKLISATLSGHIWNASNGKGAYITQYLPASTYNYTESAPVPNLVPQTTKPTAFQTLPVSYPGATTQWIDLHGEGLQGVLHRRDEAWYYQRNENAIRADPEFAKDGLDNDIGHDFGPLQELQLFPNIKDQPVAFFDDVDGNGYQDLVVLDNQGRLHGYVECVDEKTWNPLHEFHQLPNLDASEDTVQRIDLTGSGKSDVLLSSQTSNEIIWYESLGKDGFASERRNQCPENMPQLLRRNERSATYQADMSGDGLTDIMLISNGRISYWPNLGYGKFEEEIIMDGSPIFDVHDRFSPERIRLLDCDGSGTTDILYLLPDGGAFVYYNLCGNGWSDGVFIASVPHVNNLSEVFAMDLLGKGTSCLCWSGPENGDPTREYVISYLDLGGTAKPNLLESWSTGTGLSTSITYSPSTKFYLQDERLGRPWTTKLPFPVHTVSRVVARDDVIGSTHTTKYSYHDGHYDRYEREFRGFGVVDKWETEEFSNIFRPKKYKKPTCHTKLWFHTGSEQLGLAPSNSAPFGKVRLQSSVPLDLYTDDLLDAYRALKGSQLRMESYGEDRSSKADIPYVVEESSYDVIMSTPSQGDTQSATFRVQVREKLSIQYERNKHDSRMVHDLILETNDYGDVTKAVHAQYGRSVPHLTDLRGRVPQSSDYITYTEAMYTNDIDEPNNFYKPMIASIKEFHVSRGSGKQPLDLVELRLDGVQKLEGSLQKGKDTRTYYSSTSLDDKPLALGKIQVFSHMHQEFQLALTRSAFEETYAKSENPIRGFSFDDLVSKHCAYADLDNDRSLWIPSKQLLFGNENTSKTDRLLEARKCFLIPGGSKDPFGNIVRVQLDEFGLLPIKTVDAVGNTTRADNDYRTMEASTVTDANGNRLQLVYDCFGEKTAMAKMGKVNERVGDSLEGVSPAVSENEIFSFVRQPTRKGASNLLGKSGTRWLSCKSRRTHADSDVLQPAFSINLTRTEHLAYGIEDYQGDVCVNVTYLDGRGHAFQQFNLVDWDDVENRWTCASNIIQDAAGNTIMSLTSYFSADCIFKTLTDTKQPRTITFIDPLSRQLGVLSPDHTWTKKQLTPWSVTEFDAGDNVSVTDPSLDEDVGYFFAILDKSLYQPSWYSAQLASADKSAQVSARQSLEYAGKPSISHLDSRGKIISTVEMGNNRSRTTQFEYDVFGDQIAMYDALGRLVEKTTYDNLGRPICRIGMDIGSQTFLLDCLGNSVIESNDRGIQRRFVHDSLRRKTQTWVWERETPAEVLWSKVMYGEEEQNISRDAAALNLRNQISVISDQAGICRFLQYDFKGNCLGSSLQLAVEYKSVLNWANVVELQEKVYLKSAIFDGFNREIASTDAVGCTTKRKFNLLGGIESIVSTSRVSETTPIRHVVKSTYTSDGKPSQVDYGNSSHSSFLYDDKTRLLVSRRTWRDDGTILEASIHTYDCLGRLVHVVDNAQQTEFFRNCQVIPCKTFWYDEFGRLANATGRETIESGGNSSRSLRVASASSPLAKGLLPSEGGSDLCEYFETYSYDDADNILKVQHDSSDPSISGWTRKYHYEEDSLLESSRKCNRLSYTNIGKMEEQYGYDKDAGKVGCMTFMTGYSRLAWDVNNKLRYSARQRVNDGEPQTTWYVYDDNGQRIRKVTDCEVTSSSSSPTDRKLKETLYLDSAEVFLTYMGDGYRVEATKFTSLVYGTGQDKRPVATIEEQLLAPDGKSKKSTKHKGQLIRHHVSSDLELDDSAQVISYEEYNPFGVSVLLACKSDIEAPRRYRYAAYHRDHETGFYACGARYYAPWLGRWTSPDPLGSVDGPNLYGYVNNDPVNWSDPQGTHKFKIHPEPKPGAEPTAPEKNKTKTIKLPARAQVYLVHDDRRGGVLGKEASLKTPQDILKFHKMVKAELKAERPFIKGLIEDHKGTIARKAATLLIGEALGLVPAIGTILKGGFNVAASQYAAAKEMKAHEHALDTKFLMGCEIGKILALKGVQEEAGVALDALQQDTPEGVQKATEILSGLHYGKDNLPTRDAKLDEVYFTQSHDSGNGVENNKKFPGGYSIGKGIMRPTGIDTG